MDGDVSAIEQQEIVEFDLDFARRSEIGIQCVKSASSTRNTFELSDLARDLGSHRDDEFVKSVDGLSDAAVDGLADCLDSEFFVENNLYGGAFGDGERDGLVGRSRSGGRDSVLSVERDGESARQKSSKNRAFRRHVICAFAGYFGKFVFDGDSGAGNDGSGRVGDDTGESGAAVLRPQWKCE